MSCRRAQQVFGLASVGKLWAKVDAVVWTTCTIIIDPTDPQCTANELLEYRPTDPDQQLGRSRKSNFTISQRFSFSCIAYALHKALHGAADFGQRVARVLRVARELLASCSRTQSGSKFCHFANKRHWYSFLSRYVLLLPRKGVAKAQQKGVAKGQQKRSKSAAKGRRKSAAKAQQKRSKRVSQKGAAKAQQKRSKSAAKGPPHEPDEPCRFVYTRSMGTRVRVVSRQVIQLQHAQTESNPRQGAFIRALLDSTECRLPRVSQCSTCSTYLQKIQSDTKRTGYPEEQVSKHRGSRQSTAASQRTAASDYKHQVQAPSTSTKYKHQVQAPSTSTVHRQARGASQLCAALNKKSTCAEQL